MDLNIGAALWLAARAEGKVSVVLGSSTSTSHSCSQQGHSQQPAELPYGHQDTCPKPAGTAVMGSPENSQGSSVCCTATCQQGSSQQTAAPSSQPSHSAGNPKTACPQEALQVTADGTKQISRSALSGAALRDARSTAGAQSEAGPDNKRDMHACEACDARGEPCTTRYEWYRSGARVVLLGHGADEQHAGYGRHRTSFRNQVQALHPSLS